MGRWASVPVAVAVLVLALAAVAGAATGDLTSQGCIQDNDIAAPDNCDPRVDGLEAAQAVVVSADGRSVYAASRFDDAIVRFDRDPATGALTPQGCVDDDDTGGDNCAQQAPGLGETTALALSPDGSSLYAVSSADHAIVRFNRDPATGAIAFQNCIEDDDTGQADCASAAPGLDQLYSVAVSPEGNSVYTASLGDHAIARFDRDTATGALNFAFCFEDNDDGNDDCNVGPGKIDGLGGAIGVTVSPDGASVYAAAEADDSVVRFDRTPATGFISAQGCIDDNDAGQGPDNCGQSTDGLDRVQVVAVSPDNASVYAGSRDDDAVVRFDRAADGALAPQGCVDDNDTGPDNCAQSADGLDDVFGLAVSGDNLSLYAAARGDDAIAIFDRSLNPGALTPRGCVEDNDPPQGADECAQGADGLNGVRSVAPAPDGSSLYSAAEFDEAVAIFARDTGAAPVDTDPPETTITKKPKKKTKKRKAKFKFSSDEAGVSFQCKLDKKDFKPCDPVEAFKVKRRKHKLQVRAVDAAGNVDPTPAKAKWKVRKPKK